MLPKIEDDAGDSRYGNARTTHSYGEFAAARQELGAIKCEVESGRQAFWERALAKTVPDPVYFSPPHLPLKTSSAVPYNISANITTTVNPKWIARMVAITALKTEAQPFTPHTQGMNAGAVLPNRANPNGNGMPMQNASGAMSIAEMTSFTKVGNQFNQENNGPSARR